LEPFPPFLAAWINCWLKHEWKQVLVHFTGRASYEFKSCSFLSRSSYCCSSPRILSGISLGTYKVTKPKPDMVFWLIGANAPIMKVHFKCILKKLKNSDKIFRVCIWTYYVHPRKFWCEKTFFVACIKKTKKCYVNSNYVPQKFVFFT
jgi:hypothetical protein